MEVKYPRTVDGYSDRFSSVPKKHTTAPGDDGRAHQLLSAQNCSNAAQRRPYASAVLAEMSRRRIMRAAAAPALAVPTAASTPTSAAARQRSPCAVSSPERQTRRPFARAATRRASQTGRACRGAPPRGAGPCVIHGFWLLRGSPRHAPVCVTEFVARRGMILLVAPAFTWHLYATQSRLWRHMASARTMWRHKKEALLAIVIMRTLVLHQELC